MANIKLSDKKLLEEAFGMNGGYVLDFSDKSFAEFFSALGIDITDEQYLKNGTSKANRLRAFWEIGNEELVAQSIIEMADMVINKDLSILTRTAVLPAAKQIMDARRIQMDRVKDIANKLRDVAHADQPVRHGAAVENNFQLLIRPEIFNHIKQYLETGDHFHAVEEAYKLVRHKLREITGCERASEAFNMNAENTKYWQRLFGQNPVGNTPEYDFCRGVGYLHLGIQFLRNEKAHKPASELDINLAMHYIVLASLGYELISRGVQE